MLSLFKKPTCLPTPSLIAHHKDSGYSGRAIEFLSVPRYPPFDKGLPNVSVEDILTSQTELIAKIQANYGLLAPIFREMVLSVIHNYAKYIHLLPATNSSHFRGAGGLFRLGIEVAFHSYQAAQEYVFSGNFSAERRRMLEPRWQHAAFIAGLCSEIYHSLTEMVVVDANGKQWQSYMDPLSDWLNKEPRSTYYIRWTDNPSANREISGSYVIHSIVPKNVMEYLNEASLDIIPQLLGAVVNSNRLGHENQLQQIVRNVKLQVIERDTKADPASYGKLTVGVHLERYFIDAMRLLISKGVWLCNQRKSRIWINHEGVFIVWPKAGQEIIDVLTGDRLPGIPNTTESVADFLLSAKVIEINPATRRLIWDIYIPSQKSTFMAIKISRPEILYETEIPALINESFMPPDKSKIALNKSSLQQKGKQLVTGQAKEKPDDVTTVPLSAQDSIIIPDSSSSLTEHQDSLPPIDAYEEPQSLRNESGQMNLLDAVQISDDQPDPLPESVAQKLAKIADYLSYPANRDKGMFIEDGLLIPFTLLNTLQFDISLTLSSFESAGLLKVNAQGKKIHDLKYQGSLQKVCVINRQSALLYDLCKTEWWENE
jgi:conjugal transfer pilus assembly protein TraI